MLTQNEYIPIVSNSISYLTLRVVSPVEDKIFQSVSRQIIRPKRVSNLISDSGRMCCA